MQIVGDLLWIAHALVFAAVCDHTFPLRRWRRGVWFAICVFVALVIGPFAWFGWFLERNSRRRARNQLDAA